MIYIARFFSLVGGIIALLGIFTFMSMVLLEHEKLIPQFVQDQGLLVMLITSLGAVVLVIGQLCGNDLFKVTGKDSIIALKHDPDRNSGPFSGPDFN